MADPATVTTVYDSSLKLIDGARVHFGSGASRLGAGDASIRHDGTSLIITGAANLVGAQNIDGAIDQDVALVAAGDGLNSATTINHATAAAQGLDVSVAQLTTARTSGIVDGVAVSLTSLAGDIGGTYNDISLSVTDGGGTVTHNGIKFGAGFDTHVLSADALKLASTSGSVASLSDGVATLSMTSGAVTIPGATTIAVDAGSTLTLTATTAVVIGDAGAPTVDLAGAGAVTASGNPTINLGTGALTLGGATTTTQGVASGTALVVGGRALAADTGAAVTNDTAETVSATLTLPAATLTQGKTVRIRWACRATATNSTDTLTARLRLGGVAGTLLQATSAVDVADNNVASGEFEFAAEAAPSAASSVVGIGSHSTFASTTVVGSDFLTPTNHATNGALVLAGTLQWSVADVGNSGLFEYFRVTVE